MDYIDEQAVMARADELYRASSAGEVGIQSRQVKAIATALIEEMNAALSAIASAAGVPQ
jgi:hypothetical protein